TTSVSATSPPKPQPASRGVRGLDQFVAKIRAFAQSVADKLGRFARGKGIPMTKAIPAFALHYHPAMLGEEDRQIYYEATRNTYAFRGSIVDLGTYVGGSTAALVLGLINNTGFHGARPLQARVHAYDLFQCDHVGAPMLNTECGSERYRVGDDILPIF